MRSTAAAGVVALGALFFLAPPVIERKVRERLDREAVRRGMVLRVEAIHFSYFAPLNLERVSLEKGSRFKFTAVLVGLGWRPARHRLDWLRSIEVRGTQVELPDDTTFTIEDSTWDVNELRMDRIDLARRGERDRLLAVFPNEPGGGRGVEASFTDLDLGRLVTVRRRGAVPFRTGSWTGRATLCQSPDETLDLDFVGTGRGIQMATLSEVSDEDASPASQTASVFGSRTNVEVSTQARFDPAGDRLSVSCWRLVSSGVELSGEGTVESGAGDLAFDIRLDVPRVELASVLATSGVEMPPGATANLGGDLGSVALTADASGHLLDPDSIKVAQHLTFHPPNGGVRAFEFLRSPFTVTLPRPEGDRRISLVPGAPEFVALADVPPLFIRTLTIAEDAGFWSHPGIDLAEMPVAWATNWVRGEKARGASTLSQQLVKNLFLSRRKSYDRKVQELALTLLLESSIGKRRILEIYLNVIEWGPGVYGLRPAARHYFDKKPGELTPKEMVFLVSLIPGPIRYQTSFVKGAVTRGFNVLLTNLLAKLRSVDAISDEEYEAALVEQLAFRSLKSPEVPGIETAPEIGPPIRSLPAPHS